MNSVAIYASFYPGLKQLAETHGYALTIHDSLARDFDLVAIPWTETASDAETLVEALKSRLGGYFNPADTLPIIRPHGRLCWPIWLDGKLYIDLAVMPLVKEEVIMNDSGTKLIDDGTLVATIRDSFKLNTELTERCINSGAMSKPEWAAEWIINEIKRLESFQDKVLEIVNGYNDDKQCQCDRSVNYICHTCEALETIAEQIGSLK